MTQRQGNVSLDVDATLGEADLHNMYNELYRIVCVVVSTTEGVERSPFTVYSTGFCVNRLGYFIVCASCLQYYDETETLRLRYKDGNRGYDASVIHSSIADGYAILKVVGSTFDYGIIENDFSITMGMDAFSIAHTITDDRSESYVYFIGRVAFTKKKSELVLDADEFACLVMLDDEAQIFCCVGSHLVNADSARGAPIFNKRGQVFGMIVSVVGSAVYALSLIEDGAGLSTHINNSIDNDILRSRRKKGKSKIGDSGPSRRR